MSETRQFIFFVLLVVSVLSSTGLALDAKLHQALQAEYCGGDL